jgi:hypothetical protein
VRYPSCSQRRPGPAETRGRDRGYHLAGHGPRPGHIQDFRRPVCSHEADGFQMSGSSFTIGRTSRERLPGGPWPQGQVPFPRETQASIVAPSARSAAESKVPRWMTVPARTDRRPNGSDAKAPVRSIWRKPRSGVNGVGAASGWLARARTGLPRARQHRQCAAPSTIARTGLAAAPFALSYGLSVGLGASGWQPGGPTTCCPRRIERPNAHTGCRISSSLERPVLPTAVSHQLSPSSRTRQREV